MIKHLSRRTFLRVAASSSAIALPAAAESTGVEAIPLNDEQALEACIGQLKNILQRMHPTSHSARHFLQRKDDGGYWLSMQASVSYADFEGDGFYMISIDGHLIPHYVKEAERFSMNGRSLGRHFLCYQWVENDFHDGTSYFLEPRFFHIVNIVRKLTLPDGVTIDDLPYEEE
ncbi:hypothetical protein [Pararhizobium gei]|uniref:hypothetical protein n=1 Tax=Pararhizobium gei TaxID=1395951 RepID=UPI0023D9E5DE|nr:hypothetical protein [Rhizobium gei]